MWFWKKSPKKTWVGSVNGAFTDLGVRWDFWFQLYEDETGHRSYSVTGRFPAKNAPEQHGRYSAVVHPWLNSKYDQYQLNVWATLDFCNPEYWDKYPDIMNECEMGFINEYKVPGYVPSEPEKKPEFKLLKFPQEHKEEVIKNE